MPGLYDEDDDYTDGPKALRDALAKAKKELAERDSKIAELESSSADLAKKLKTTTLRDALSDAGVDPKYARFAERDEVDADVESVKKWAAENADVYAFLSKPAPAQRADDSDEDDSDGQEDQLPEGFVNQILAGQQVENSGRPSGSSTVLDALTKVDPAQFKTERELDDYIKSLGAPTAHEG